MFEFEYKDKKIKIVKSKKEYFTESGNQIEIGVKVESLYDSTKQALGFVSDNTLKSHRSFLFDEAQKTGEYTDSELKEFKEMERAISDILNEREN